MDLKRITSGFIVGLALAVILLIQNNIIIGLLFTLIAIVAMHEYLGAITKVCKPVKWVAYLSCAIVAMPSFITTLHIIRNLLYTNIYYVSKFNRWNEKWKIFIGLHIYSIMGN